MGQPTDTQLSVDFIALSGACFGKAAATMHYAYIDIADQPVTVSYTNPDGDVMAPTVIPVAHSKSEWRGTLSA